MSRRRKSKPKSSAKTAKKGSFSLGSAFAGIRNLNWTVLRQAGAGIAWLGCVGGLTAAWILGVPRLEAYASQRQVVEPHDVTIRFVDPPQWLQGDIANTLLRTATMQLQGDPFQRNDLVAVRESLLGTGWFDSIEQVRRLDPELVEISAHFVRPYTVIRDAKGDHLIDPDAKLLPLSYERGKGPSLIAISGAHFQRPAQLGAKWEGSDVQAALAMLRVLERQPWRNQVAEIDVSAFLSQAMIRLKTTSGSVIVWGGAPGQEPALEVLAEGKLARLSYLFKNHGRIDGGNSGELDITGEKAVVIRTTDS